MSIVALKDLQVQGKRILMRVDFNVPLTESGSAGGRQVVSDQRVMAALPGIQSILDQGGQLALMSHLGRPTEGQYDAEFSLKPVADHLAALLGRPVPLVTDWLDQPELLSEARPLLLCENVRFNSGEKGNDLALAKKMARHCDLFVMDAFGTAHRAQASTAGIAQFAPEVAAGPLLMAELAALRKALQAPAKPLVAVVGGAKVSTKLTVLERLLAQVDQLIVGGGIANTFLAAAGYAVGQSLHEPDLIATAKTLLQSGKIPLPTDVVVAKAFSAEEPGEVKPVDQVGDDEMILDIGPETAEAFAQLIAQAGTLVWNGPVGVFEMAPFAQGTARLAEAIARAPGFSLAGGGDTLAAIDQFNVADQIDYISTGGGAFLEFLEGKDLPAVLALSKANRP